MEQKAERLCSLQEIVDWINQTDRTTEFLMHVAFEQETEEEDNG